MSCSICGTIPDVATANTGRDQYFEAPITSLKRHPGNDEALWECPACGGVFLWHDDRSWTGSGNNDEEVLTRCKPAEQTILRSILHRGERGFDADGLIALSELSRELVLAWIRTNDHALARQLAPWMLDAIDRDWAFAFVKSLAAGDDAALVNDAIATRRSSPRLEEIARRCQRTLCSICHTISPIARIEARRSALVAPLNQLARLDASANLDLWWCPMCDSMFTWESSDGIEGIVSRTTDAAGGAIRDCLDREDGHIAELSREMVFASDGRRWLKVVLARGVESDRDMIRQFVPRMILELVLNDGEWLRDLLCKLVRESSDDAAIVLDAIAKSPRTNALVDEVASVARMNTLR